MSVKEREAELKDVESLLGDLEVKIEELKAAPEVPDLVTQSIDHLLGKQLEASGSASGIGFGGAGVGAGAEAAPVNDLTSMVRKKPAKKASQPAAAVAPAAASASASGSGSGSGSASGDGNGELKRKADEANGAGTEAKKAKAD